MSQRRNWAFFVPLRTMLMATALASASATAAQQVTGTLGSPESTITLDGAQMPPPDPKFGGVIKERASGSTPWWAPRVVPPKGAPNVLLIITDDAGYAAPSTFGGVIPTPTLDALAEVGLRYTNFHSTSLCSPTRAALITGRNHHSVGFGVVGEIATGYPGHDSIIPVEKGTIDTSCATTATRPRGSARTTIRRSIMRARPGPSTSGRRAWASSTSTASSAATRASGSRTFSATPPRSIPSRTIPART